MGTGWFFDYNSNTFSNDSDSDLIEMENIEDTSIQFKLFNLKRDIDIALKNCDKNSFMKLSKRYNALAVEM